MLRALKFLGEQLSNPPVMAVIAAFLLYEIGKAYAHWFRTY